MRAEYPLAVTTLRQAIEQAREYGVLGSNILGSGTDFDITIKEGAGAFVCGEETALIHSIEGQRGMPRMRPPYPSVHGLWGCPTNINNVETYCSVPSILRVDSPALIQNSGLVEVPLGMALRGLIGNIGGGCQSGRAFTAVQLGGPSGGCLPPDLLATCIDYDEIARVTPISGGIRHARLAGQGLVWPCPSADHPGTPILHTQTFTRGRGRFHAIAAQGPAEEPDATFPLILTTGRILCQYHTGTMTRRSEGLTWRESRGYAEIHEQDAAAAGIGGGPVLITSRRGQVRTQARVGQRVPPGTVFLSFHWKEAPPTCSRRILPWTRWQRFPSIRSVPCVLNVHGRGRTARRSTSQHRSW